MDPAASTIRRILRGLIGLALASMPLASTQLPAPATSVLDRWELPAHGGLFSPLSPYYQPGLGYPFDPARAKQLIAKYG